MKVLMVCLGNICRSPLAEGILASKLDSSHAVDSAGTDDYHEGELPDARSIETAAKYGIDITNQRSRLLQASDLEEFDLIYAMDKSNLNNILKLAETPEQKEKVKLILEENDEDTENEVPDPYYGATEGFEKVYHMLDKATDKIVNKILNS